MCHRQARSAIAVTLRAPDGTIERARSPVAPGIAVLTERISLWVRGACERETSAASSHDKGVTISLIVR